MVIIVNDGRTTQHACLPQISLQIVVMALIVSSPIAFTGSMYYQLPMCPPFQRFYCCLHFLAKDEVVVDVCIPFTYIYIDYLKIAMNKLRITTRNEQCDSIDNENRSIYPQATIAQLRISVYIDTTDVRFYTFPKYTIT